MSDVSSVTVFDPAEIPACETSDACVYARDPVVSVTMVSYNHAPWIGQAIEGVVQQKTAFPIELIIAEDCSTDKTREIVWAYQKRHPEMIRVITSDGNVGAKKNACRAHRACRGRYTAVCEGDDFWHHPHKLQMQVDCLERHPDIGLVHSDCDVFLAHTGRTVSHQDKAGGRVPRIEGDLFSSILAGTYKIRTATVCVRTSLLEQVWRSDPILFCSDCFPMGDTPTWLELSRLTQFKYLDESLATYRVLSESACHSMDVEKIIDFEKQCYELRRYFMDKYPCRPEIHRKIEQMWQGRFIDLAFKTGNVRMAEDAYQQLQNVGLSMGWRGAFKRWATQPGCLNTLARAVQAYTRPLRSRNTHFCQY